MTQLTPFHLAIQVRDINEARLFYGEKLGFPEGRHSNTWVDFDMFGHQFVVHLNEKIGKAGKINFLHTNQVDKKAVPTPHFGVVLTLDTWHSFAEKVSGVIDDFIIKPQLRFKGEVGEQATMFFADPSGNVLEFKAFQNITKQLFSS